MIRLWPRTKCKLTDTSRLEFPQRTLCRDPRCKLTQTRSSRLRINTLATGESSGDARNRIVTSMSNNELSLNRSKLLALHNYVRQLSATLTESLLQYSRKKSICVETFWPVARFAVKLLLLHR